MVKVPRAARQGSAFAGKARGGRRCLVIGDDEKRGPRAQTPGALRVTGGCAGTPCICSRGARNATRGTFTTGS